MKTELIWNEKAKTLPISGRICLVYSPQYKGKVNYSQMLIRVMDGQFVRIASDVSLWAYIEEPT